MPATALPAAQEQLRYWQHARALAVDMDDALRIARCDEFIVEMERIISTLQYAAQYVPKPK
jgi:hypothetical protein